MDIRGRELVRWVRRGAVVSVQRLGRRDGVRRDEGAEIEG